MLISYNIALRISLSYMDSLSSFLQCNIPSFTTVMVLLTLLMNCSIGSSSNAVQPCDFQAIFNFGDSNSDTGGLCSAFPPQLPPYGETFFHWPTGRASDGRLIIDFMAEELNLPYLHAYLNSTEPDFSIGANFAVQGSTIVPTSDVLPLGGYSPFPFEVQRAQYSHHIIKSESHFFNRSGGFVKNSLPKEESNIFQALYTIDIGQNDLNAAILNNMTVEEIKASIPHMIDIFSANVKSLYNQGGRSFWIHNTGPIGCLPSILTSLPALSFQRDPAGCAIQFNKVSQFFNGKLRKAVFRLRKDLPLATIAYVDIYSAKYSLISNASMYGFTKPLVACCGYGGKYNFNDEVLCGQAGIIDGIPVYAGSCADPSVQISWDGIHYTEAANKWIYGQIESGKLSDPPLSLKMACIPSRSSESHWKQ